MQETISEVLILENKSSDDFVLELNEKISRLQSERGLVKQQISACNVRLASMKSELYWLNCRVEGAVQRRNHLLREAEQFAIPKTEVSR